VEGDLLVVPAKPLPLPEACLLPLTTHSYRSNLSHSPAYESTRVLLTVLPTRFSDTRFGITD
jgi:hypothetical protein